MEGSSEKLVLQNNIWCRNTSIYYCTMPNRTYVSFFDLVICSQLYNILVEVMCGEAGLQILEKLPYCFQAFFSSKQEGSLLITLSQIENLQLKDPLRSSQRSQPESIIKKILTKISTYKTRNELDTTFLLQLF